MVGTPIFWVMYLMFVMMAAGGLMATAQLGPIAKDFKIAEVPVSLIGITLPALTFAATIDRVLNGLTRPFFGWVSDHIGRENTMFLAFAIEGVGIWALSVYGQNPLLFVILTGLVFFAWGEIYSLFPATCGDTFGIEVRSDERRAPLHRQGHGGADRALHQRPHHHDRELARGLPRRGRPQHRRGPDGDLRPEADAEGVRQVRGRAGGGAGDDRARPRRVKRATSDRNGPARTSGRPSCIGARA